MHDLINLHIVVVLIKVVAAIVAVFIVKLIMCCFWWRESFDWYHLPPSGLQSGNSSAPLNCTQSRSTIETIADIRCRRQMILGSVCHHELIQRWGFSGWDFDCIRQRRHTGTWGIALGRDYFFTRHACPRSGRFSESSNAWTMLNCLEVIYCFYFKLMRFWSQH